MSETIIVVYSFQQFSTFFYKMQQLIQIFCEAINLNTNVANFKQMEYFVCMLS